MHAPARVTAPTRWLRRAAFVVAPLLFLYAIVAAPAWVHDFQLSRLVDRVVQYPPPTGGSAPSFWDAQSRVSGDSGDCTFHVRFDVVTDRPVEEVLTHYETAADTLGGEDLAEVSFGAWVPLGFGQPTRRSAVGQYQTVIVDVSAEGRGSALWDMRCY